MSLTKPLLTLKRYVARSNQAGPAVDQVRKSPGLYECSDCSQVFISSPSECSRCGCDDFAQVADFKPTS